MKVGKGLKVNLFASEKEFPELVNPVQMAFDTKGRLWVAVWPTYPHWKPKKPMNDKLLILEDTDGDGKADKCTIFADDLHNPTGFEFWNGGVIVVAGARTSCSSRTPTATTRPTRKQILIGGLDSADTHHAINSFVLDPGGALYFQEGTSITRRSRRRGARRCARPTAASSATSRGRTSSTSTSRWLRQPARPRLRPLGPGHRRRRHRRQPYHGPSISTKKYFPAKQSTKAPRLGQERTRPVRHRRSSRAATSPTRCRATCSCQRHRLPGHAQLQDQRGRRQLEETEVEPIL